MPKVRQHVWQGWRTLQWGILVAYQSGGFPESCKISEQQRGKNGDSDSDPPIPSLRLVKLY